MGVLIDGKRTQEEGNQCSDLGGEKNGWYISKKKLASREQIMGVGLSFPRQKGKKEFDTAWEKGGFNVT